MNDPDFDKLDELIVREENDLQQSSLVNNQNASDRLSAELRLKESLLEEIDDRRQTTQRYVDLAKQISTLAAVNRAALDDAQTHLRSVMASIAQLEIEGFR